MSWGCHTAPVDSGGDATQVCAGYLQSKDSRNHDVFMAVMIGLLPGPSQIKSDEPLFATLSEMLDAVDSAQGGASE